MPRRPRPAHRPAPRAATGQPKLSSTLNRPNTATKARFADPEPEHSEQEDASDADTQAGNTSREFEEGSSQDSMLDQDSDSEGDNEDADAPRIVQWEDDEEEQFLKVHNDVEEDPTNLPSEKFLRNNLQDLPLGALRRAQQALSQAEADISSNSEPSDDEEESDSESDAHDGKVKSQEKVEWSTKPRKDISKRPNKHAPMEISSKKPVTRRRTVVEVPKIIPRDPRFLPTAGQFSPEKFHKQYSFLAESHKTELATLRESLKRARKLLSSSPRDLRSEREQEVERLERAVKRAESIVNKDRLDQVEREAMSKVKKDEREKRAHGKNPWYLKKGEKHKLLVQARYEALAKEGGQRAVKKAIEKKQKKVGQKEKRSRPFAKGEEPPAAKRRRVA